MKDSYFLNHTQSVIRGTFRKKLLLLISDINMSKFNLLTMKIQFQDESPVPLPSLRPFNIRAWSCLLAGSIDE